MNEHVIWFLAGLVPYYIKWVYLARGGWTLEMRALFWWLRSQNRSGAASECILHLPLIERVRDGIWAAVTRLRADPSLHELEDDASQRRTEEKKVE